MNPLERIIAERLYDVKRNNNTLQIVTKTKTEYLEALNKKYNAIYLNIPLESNDSIVFTIKTKNIKMLQNISKYINQISIWFKEENNELHIYLNMLRSEKKKYLKV